MANVNEILMDYTAGKETLEATNKALMEADAGFHLDPHKHDLTAYEVVNGTAGLLDTGTGTLDKVYVKDGHINVDCGESYALCMVSGKTYHVQGTELVE